MNRIKKIFTLFFTVVSLLVINQNKAEAYALAQLNFSMDGIGAAIGGGSGDAFGLLGFSHLFNTVPEQYKGYSLLIGLGEYVDTYYTAGFELSFKLGWRGLAKGTFVLAGLGLGVHSKVDIYREENGDIWGNEEYIEGMFMSFMIGGGIQIGKKILLEVTYNTRRELVFGIGFILK